MKGGPSIAVMLGAPHHEGADEDESAEPGLEETKAGEKDAAKAFASAVKSGDPDAIVRSFRALSTLCHESSELEESESKYDKDEESSDEG